MLSLGEEATWLGLEGEGAFPSGARGAGLLPAGVVAPSLSPPSFLKLSQVTILEGTEQTGSSFVFLFFPSVHFRCLSVKATCVPEFCAVLPLSLRARPCHRPLYRWKDRSSGREGA